MKWRIRSRDLHLRRRGRAEGRECAPAALALGARVARVPGRGRRDASSGHRHGQSCHQMRTKQDLHATGRATRASSTSTLCLKVSPINRAFKGGQDVGAADAALRPRTGTWGATR